MAIEKWNAPAQGREKTGFTMVKVGAGAGALWLGACLLPFVTFPMLFILLIIAGIVVSF